MWGDVFHHQLWSGAAVGQGRPLELNRPWSADQGCAGCPQWPLAMAGSAVTGCVPLAPIEGAGTLQTHCRAQQFCSTSPSLEELSQPPPECTLAAGYASSRQYHGERDHLSLPPWEHLFRSLPDYPPQREGWLPGGPGVLQRGPLLCSLIPGWVWGT